jgi:hypothetical protein
MGQSKTLWLVILMAAGVAGTAVACLPGAACNTDQDCPAPLACETGRCRNPDGSGASSGSSGASSGTAGLATHCRELLAQNPALARQDGLQNVQFPAGDGGVRALTLWCDMTTAGGGWTLVGRSLDDNSGSQPNFGWSSSAGNVTDDARAYSLNLVRNAIPFTEILFGSRLTGKTWANAYRVTVPPDFVTEFQTKTLDVWPPTPAVGSCNPPDPMGAPGFMGRYVGFTNNRDGFFFRDNQTNENFGLNHQSWNLSGDDTDCMRNGLMQGHEGMVMVR